MDRVLVGSLILLGMASTLNATDTRPNFVFIMADDCTFRDIGCYGGEAETPNIDALATEGMRFANCFQAAPMCSPTRHNIYTGLYPVRSGAYPNHTFANDGVKSVVQFLRPLGYRVALSGKRHIGPRSVFPFEYSDDENNPDLEEIDALIRESTESDTPFCLFACSNEPHRPWDKGDASRYPPGEVRLPPYIIDTPQVRDAWSRYLAEITYYDDQVGQILRLLEKYDLKKETMVMVVSEQGNSFPFAKWTCYDNGLQSAMVVRWPGEIEPGVTIEAMVEYVDILPTFVEAAGGIADPRWDGSSFLPVLRGQADQHKEFAYSLMTTRGINHGSDAYPIRSIRSDRYRFILNLNPDVEFTNALTHSALYASMIERARSDPEAAILIERYARRPALELFDVDADPYNMKNIADDPELKSIVNELEGRLLAWMKDQGDEGMATELRAESRQSRNRKKTAKE